MNQEQKFKIDETILLDCLNNNDLESFSFYFRSMKKINARPLFYIMEKYLRLIQNKN